MKVNIPDRCNNCGGRMSHFKGYFPRIGNVCKTCYDLLLLEGEFLNIGLDKDE